MITITSTGDFSKTQAFLQKMTNHEIVKALDHYGSEGVRALSQATPKDTSYTAGKWDYEIVQGEGKYAIIWGNSNVKSDVPVAILLQYGHATRNGGWVEGIDYINPALRPIFDRIVNDAWKVVTSS